MIKVGLIGQHKTTDSIECNVVFSTSLMLMVMSGVYVTTEDVADDSLHDESHEGGHETNHNPIK